jgi:hypothetical protein
MRACLACLVCLAAWLYVPFAAFGQIDYDRHVIFDNSLADGSWYYSRSHVVGPSELDLVDGKLPVDGSHCLTPPNALRLNWRSAFLRRGIEEMFVHADQAGDHGLSRHLQHLGVGRIRAVRTGGLDSCDLAASDVDAHVFLGCRACAVDMARMLQH